MSVSVLWEDFFSEGVFIPGISSVLSERIRRKQELLLQNLKFHRNTATTSDEMSGKVVAALLRHSRAASVDDLALASLLTMSIFIRVVRIVPLDHLQK